MNDGFRNCALGRRVGGWIGAQEHTDKDGGNIRIAVGRKRRLVLLPFTHSSTHAFSLNLGVIPDEDWRAVVKSTPKYGKGRVTTDIELVNPETLQAKH